MVGAGAVVVESVPPYAVVAGNPARIVSYCDAGAAPVEPAVRTETARVGKSRVPGVFVERLSAVEDLRGKLVAGEIDAFLPFKVKRFFIVHGVPGREVRGQHAHLACHQFLTCIRGSCRVIADDGSRRQEFRLDDPVTGIYIPPRVWSVQYDYSSDAALLVFASHAYDPRRLRARLRGVSRARPASCPPGIACTRTCSCASDRRADGRNRAVQFARFLVVGTANTAASYVVYLLLLLVVD